MKIEWLREFLALAQTLNYRIAADTVFVSQSTLSKHIKCLEGEIGVDLFKRSTKSVSMTENGKLFLGYAERIIHEYDEVMGKFGGNRPMKGLLRIAGGIRMPVINELLYPGMGAFEEKYPDVDIYATDIQWEDYRASLLNGSYDVVLSVHLPGANEEGLIFYDLCELPLCAWVPKKGHFEGRQSVSAKELSGLYLRVLNPHESRGYLSFIRGIFDKRGCSVKIGKPLNWAFSMDGNGFGITPKFSPSESFGAGIRVLDLEEDETVAISLVRRKREFNPMVNLFLDEFTACLPDTLNHLRENGEILA